MKGSGNALPFRNKDLKVSNSLGKTRNGVQQILNLGAGKGMMKSSVVHTRT